MKTVDELRKLYASKVAEATAIAEANPTGLQAEHLDKINSLMKEADEIKSQIIALEKVLDGNVYASQPAGTKAAHEGWRPAAPGEGDAPVDVKAWRNMDIQIPTPVGMITKSFRYHVPLAVQAKGYNEAFEAYVRKGRSEIGPNDRKALSEGVDISGGYLVPEDWQASVIRKIATLATVRLFARVITTSRDLVKWPRVKYTTNNEYTSGMRLTWTGEIPSSSTAHRVTDQVFGEFNIPVHTAMASQLISADLLQDAAYDVFGISAELMGEAFALGENAAFWTGTGAAQPRGMLLDLADTVNFDATIISAADTTGGSFTADEVIDVCYGLPSQYERNARWFFTKATEKAIRKLADTDGMYLWPIYGQVGGLGPAGPGLLGFPYTRDEFIDEAAADPNLTTYPIVFGDMSGYVVVDRVAMSLQRFDEIYSETNQVLLLGKKRVGGQLTEAYRFSILKTTASTS